MSNNSSLANHLLIAMPSLMDPNFYHAVVYVCEHNVDGTVGLIINRPMQYPLSIVFEQMKIEPSCQEQNQKPLLFGGPVQPERGFVIHRPKGGWRSSLILQEDVTVTTSNDIIHAIAKDEGPKDVLVALGYSGWNSKQIEKEVEDTWLVCPFTPEILYDVPFPERWEWAGNMLGVKMGQLTSLTGHA